jgi:predicted nucleic acid-binding protein
MDWQIPRSRNLTHAGAADKTRPAFRHAQHRRTLVSYEKLLAQGAQPVIPAHAILECFSVLTRLPAPYRLTPETARVALERTFAETAIIAGMNPERVWSMIEMLSRLGLGGGRVYDAAISQSVVDAGATLLLTWNTKHFLPIATAGLDVCEP